MSGWGSAIRKPYSGPPAGTHTPAPMQTPPTTLRSNVPLAPEDLALLVHYERAVKELAGEDRKFLKNWYVFRNWDNEQRLKWIYTIEAQAFAGLDTIGMHVVARVVANRLE